MALVIPVVSIAGVVLQGILVRRERRRLADLGLTTSEIERAMPGEEGLRPNWWILGGSLAFVVFTLSVGFSKGALFGGDRFCRLHGHRDVPDLAHYARVGCPGATHSGRNGDRDLRVPCGAGPRSGRRLVDLSTS